MVIPASINVSEVSIVIAAVFGSIFTEFGFDFLLTKDGGHHHPGIEDSRKRSETIHLRSIH